MAIAVPDLAAATAILPRRARRPRVPAAGAARARCHCGLRRTPPPPPPPLPPLDNSKVELLEPLGEDSPIAAFLEKNPSGGMHHLCYAKSPDIEDAAKTPRGAGCACSGRAASPASGRTAKPVLFLHPKDFAGTLVELEQA